MCLLSIHPSATSSLYNCNLSWLVREKLATSQLNGKKAALTVCSLDQWSKNEGAKERQKKLRAKEWGEEL